MSQLMLVWEIVGSRYAQFRSFLFKPFLLG